MSSGQLLPCAFEQARHVEGGSVAGNTHLLNFDAAKRSRLRKRDGIANPSENFGTEERASTAEETICGDSGALLFERISPFAPDEINSPLLDLLSG
jgi:hypothetical protein